MPAMEADPRAGTTLARSDRMTANFWGDMQVANAWGRAQVAFAAFLLLALAACGGGAPTRQLAEQSADTPPKGSSTNNAPVISGTPGTELRVGQTYSFQPLASDANGDALSFAVSNLPAWASFNTATGRLSGTPSATGSYGAITITVSDGKAAASLPMFQILVRPSATGGDSVEDPPAAGERPPTPVWPGGSGSATVQWTPPTANTDGSTLTDLVGYEVRFGSDPALLTYRIAVDNPTLASFVVDNLSAGSWYFVVVAVNSLGVASAYSNVASKTIS